MKLKCILPVATLSTVAVVAPVVTSCNSTKYSDLIEINDIVKSKVYSKEMDFDKKTTYRLQVKWDDIVKCGLEDKLAGWGLCCGSFSGTTKLNAFELSSIKIWHNEKKLSVSKEQTSDMWYVEKTIDQTFVAAILPSKTLGFQSNDIIKFEVKLSQSKELFCPKGQFAIGNL